APGGLQPLIELPSAGMRLAPAGRDACYLFGGETEVQRRELYLFSRTRPLRSLLRTEAPITAVAGDGVETAVATGSEIYLIAGGRATRIQAADGPITSLSGAPPYGLFYTTSTHAAFLHGKGRGFGFLDAKDAQ